MESSWQAVFGRLEAAGASFADVEAGRAFALDALRAIPGPLPSLLAQAQDVAERLQAGIANPDEVSQLRDDCWKCESSITAAGVLPNRNPEIAALRLAIGATESSIEPEPWFWLSNVAMLAEAAGVPTEQVGRLLEKHYET